MTVGYDSTKKIKAMKKLTDNMTLQARFVAVRGAEKCERFVLPPLRLSPVFRRQSSEDFRGGRRDTKVVDSVRVAD